jgi:hypothetical protein
MRFGFYAVLIALAMVIPQTISPAAGTAIPAHDTLPPCSPEKNPHDLTDVTYTKPVDYTTLVNWYLWLEQNYSGYICVFKANELYGTGRIPGGTMEYDDYYVRITNESLGLHKPEVLFLGGPHGDETAGTISAYWFCDWLLRHAFDPAYMDAQAPYLRWLLDNREIYIEVCHNPYGFDHKTRNDANSDDLNQEADMDCLGMPFSSVNGKTLREFLAHHQVRAGADFHGGSRSVPYPWSSTHGSVSAKSGNTGLTFNYAPPDFSYLDSSCIRLGQYMGDAGGHGGDFASNGIGPSGHVLGTTSRGTVMSWAYGADVGSNPAESPDVQEPPYPGAGVLWFSPELSPAKNPPQNEFGGDDTTGYGTDVRRFILHMTDLVQPYLKWQPGSAADNTVIKPGKNLKFRWQVNGSMVVDSTQVVWGSSPDPAGSPQYFTKNYTMNAGRLAGGTGWEGAFDGNITTPSTYEETITMPLTGGDYYFAARAVVDQRHKETVAPSAYGKNHTYLRMLKERTNESWAEEIPNGTDGKETMAGRKWWYSPVIHVKVNGSMRPFLEIDLTAPDGGERWLTGRNYRINFTLKNGSADYKIDIYLSKDSGISWFYTIVKGFILTSPGSYYYLWKVPMTFTNCSTHTIKTTVQDKNTDVATDQSRSDFEIIFNGTLPTPPVVSLQIPNGGEKWYRGDSYCVNWSVTNATAPYRVNLYLSTDGGATYPYIIVKDIPQGAPGNGSFLWAVTTAYPTSPLCMVRAEVFDAFDTTAGDESDSMFEIADRPVPKKFEVKLLSPNGGENWSSSSACDIKWSTGNGTLPVNITLEYSSTGIAGVYRTVAANISDTGTYGWTVPDLFSKNCFARITATDALGNVTSNASNSAFTICNWTPPIKRGMIAGRVNDSATGENLSGVLVNLCYSSNSTKTEAMNTFVNGTYLFPGVVTGEYDLEFRIAGYKTRWAYLVEVTPDNTTHVNMSLEKGNNVNPPPDDGNKTNGTGLPRLSLQYALYLVAGVIALLVIIIAVASRRRKKGGREGERKFRYVQKHVPPPVPAPVAPPKASPVHPSTPPSSSQPHSTVPPSVLPRSLPPPPAPSPKPRSPAPPSASPPSPKPLSPASPPAPHPEAPSSGTPSQQPNAPSQPPQVPPAKPETKEKEAAAQDGKPQRRFCTRCGSKLVPNSRFCTGCGAKTS